MTNETNANNITFTEFPEGITRIAFPDQGVFLVDFNQPLGEGKDGKVYKAYHHVAQDGVETVSDEYFAVKVISKSKSWLDDKEIEPIEVSILRNKVFNQTLSVRLKDKLFYLMEYSRCDLRTLLESNDNLSLVELFNLICSILHALNILSHHTASTGNAVYHGDIHPENILLNPQNIDGIKYFDAKIIDFTGAHKLKYESEIIRFKDVPVIPGYAAPELWNWVDVGQQLVNMQKAGVKTDIYCVSISILALLDKFLPNIPIPDELKNLDDKVGEMLRHATMNDDYNLRPNIDSVLRFFNCLLTVIKTVHKYNGQLISSKDQNISIIPDVKIASVNDPNIFKKNLDDFIEQSMLNLAKYQDRHESKNNRTIFENQNLDGNTNIENNNLFEVQNDIEDKKAAILNACQFLRSYSGSSSGIIKLKKYMETENLLKFKNLNDFNGFTLQELLLLYYKIDNNTIKMAKEKTGFIRSAWSNFSIQGFKLPREKKEDTLYTNLAKSNSIKGFSW